MSFRELRSFRHGVHPSEHKETASLPTERMPFGSSFVLPMTQHIGAPARPVVAMGQELSRGQLIAEATAFVSVPIHAPVAGRVVAIEPRRHPNGQFVESIVIEADPYSTQRAPRADPIDWHALSRDEQVERVKRGGLVGLGGAAFPAHVKYAPPADKQVSWLVLNGCECEPYLTCDHRVMVERAADVIRGAEITAEILGTRGIKIGVEINKREAIDAAARARGGQAPHRRRAAACEIPAGRRKDVAQGDLRQGGPGWEAPHRSRDRRQQRRNDGGGDRLLRPRGRRLIERVVTVAGPGITRPANLIVPLGTSVRDVLEHAGLHPETRQIVMGGPMMGSPLPSIDVPVIKGTSGCSPSPPPTSTARRSTAVFAAVAASTPAPTSSTPRAWRGWRGPSASIRWRRTSRWTAWSAAPAAMPAPRGSPSCS